MTKIAIITPCMLPVPATKGGAVETLITEIISTNEISKKLDIDVFSMSFSDSDYIHTNIITVQKTGLVSAADRVWDKLCRTFAVFNISAMRFYDNAIVNSFLECVADGMKYDAIVVENMMSVACRLIKYQGKKFNCPVYFHMHNNVDIYRSPKMIKKLHGAGIRFIAVSNYIKSEILEQESAADVSVLYNGVDITVFNHETVISRSEIRKELGMSDRDIIIQYSGRIIPEKGVVELAEAFNSLCAKEPELTDNVKLNIIGMSKENASTYERKLCEYASGNGHINLVPRVDAGTNAKYYAASDLVVIPSVFNEPFGMVALEAIAMGKTVIATEAGGLPEILDKSFAKLVSRDDLEDSLEKAIREMLVEGGLEKKGELAFKHFISRTEFDKDSFYNNFVELINKD